MLLIRGCKVTQLLPLTLALSGISIVLPFSYLILNNYSLMFNGLVGIKMPEKTNSNLFFHFDLTFSEFDILPFEWPHSSNN
jgi:hypothetical protein